MDVCVVPVPRCLITDVLTRVVEPGHQQTCVGDIKADEPRRRGGLDGGEGRKDAHEQLYSIITETRSRWMGMGGMSWMGAAAAVLE